MPRDAQATRRRILDAANEEFSARGIAGARVDRIAAAARANKAQMYAYYGSKDGLFDAVFAEQLTRIIDAVPMDAGDLPGYVTAFYDEYVRAPALIRLATWARLERQPVGDLLAGRVDENLAAKHAAIADAQGRGLIDPDLEPRDVYALVVALAGTWSPVSNLVAAHPGEEAAEHARRRELLAEMARRLLSPR